MNDLTPILLSPSKSPLPFVKTWLFEESLFMWDVMDWMLAQEAVGAVPEGHVLFGVLEDPGQASSTAGHAIEKNRLHAPRDASDLPPDLRGLLEAESLQPGRDGETEIVGLTHPDEWPICAFMFEQYLARAKAGEWRGAHWWSEDEDEPPIVAGREPEGWDLPPDRNLTVSLVPVATGRDAIAAYPQGYWGMQPIDNYVMAGVLADALGYELKGFGATYAGFARPSPLTAGEAATLESLFVLPGAEAQPAKPGHIARIAEGQRTLFLKYMWA